MKQQDDARKKQPYCKERENISPMHLRVVTTAARTAPCIALTPVLMCKPSTDGSLTRRVSFDSEIIATKDKIFGLETE